MRYFFMRSIKAIIFVIVFIRLFFGSLFYAWQRKPKHPNRRVSSICLGATIWPEIQPIDEVNMSNIVIRKKQEVRFNPIFRDEDGTIVTSLGSIPKWESSNEAVIIVTASEDGLSAVARPTGQLGSAQVRLSVDADPGEDVTTIVGTADITVVAGNAVTFELGGVVAALQPAAPAETPAPAPTAVEVPEPVAPEAPVVEEPLSAVETDPLPALDGGDEAAVNEPAAEAPAPALETVRVDQDNTTQG